MTRINVGISPADLPDKLLLAEHREIKRLPNHLSKHGWAGNAPASFKLGEGHVKFCLAIGLHTFKRYVKLHAECVRRGFKVTNYAANWLVYERFPELWKDYQPSAQDVATLVERIKQRGFAL